MKLTAAVEIVLSSAAEVAQDGVTIAAALVGAAVGAAAGAAVGTAAGTAAAVYILLSPWRTMKMTGAVVTVLISAAVVALGGTAAVVLVGAAVGTVVGAGAAVFTLLVLSRTKPNTVELAAAAAALRTKEESLSLSTEENSQSSSTEQKSQSPSTEEKSQLPSAEEKSQSPSTEEKSQLPSAEEKSKSSTTEVKSQSPSTEKKTQSLLTEKKSQSSSTEEKSQSPSSEEQSPSTEKKHNHHQLKTKHNHYQLKKKTQSSSTEEKTQLPSAKEKSQSPSTEEKSQSPSTEEKSQSPSTEEKSQSPSTEEKSQSPSTEEKSQSPSTEEKSQSPSTEEKSQSSARKQHSNLGTQRDPNQQVIGSEVERIFQRLHLNYQNKLTPVDILQITNHSLQSCEFCSEEELIPMYLQQLLMMNYRSRYIHISNTRTNTQHHQTKTSPDTSEDMKDFLTAMTQMNQGSSDSESVHPMDVQMAVFHCADVFLQKLMVAKLSQCQYALPLLIPHPVTRQIQFPLWSFRQIHKSWKTNTGGEIISQNQPIYKSQTPMVFFFRLGSESAERYSKSQIINSLINEKHNTFFHRNCPGSISTRRLMDGVVEIAWFCPSAKKTDHFTDCIAFCNLHGDAGDSLKQLEILSQASSVNVLLLTRPQKDRNSVFIKKLFDDTKPLICLITEDASSVIEINKTKFKIGLKNRNQSDVSKELRKVIHGCLSSDKTTMFRVEDLTKESDIRVDEDHVDECRSGKDAAESMMEILEEKRLTEVKEIFLPCQGKLWHQWSEKNKELHRPQTTDLEMENSTKQSEMKTIRELQNKSHTSEFIQSFIKVMKSDTVNKMFFLTWLRILMDDYTSADLLKLQHKYNIKWSEVRETKEKSEDLPDKQAELEKISEQLQAATFGMEHIMREIVQIYESCASLEKRRNDLPCEFSHLPILAAEIMASGFPLELMDGDAAHVPITWISAVLDALTQRLGDQSVFVLSVLGIQSSGKSTMLNAMFGLQFSVSAGRCTRGAFMQLVPVSDEMKTQLKTDYILVVDTERLRALELAGRQMRNRDNELATFVVGIGNLTLINIFGENPAEMQDILQIIVQAFLRMKEVRLSPSCLFVHQNVSDVTAGDKNTEGRRRLLETLDEMTKLCAKEGAFNVETFSDVIGFDIRHDVKYFAQLWEGSPPLAPPNPSYCENIQQLKTTILNRLPESQKIRLSDLKSRINDLWEALLNEGFIFSFRNTLEISAYRKLETKYSQWSWDLRSAVMEAESKLYNKIENEVIHKVEEMDLYQDLDETCAAVEKSMSEFFETDKDKDLLIQWKSSFEIKIKELQQNIVKSTMKKLQEILQQREVKKKIDSQRTQHENALFEKSKELALKFKDKANDDKTLKNEFDLFWNESVKKIIRDTPTITDINVIGDVRQILRENYSEQLRVEQLHKSIDLLTVKSYSNYVVFTQSTRKGFTGKFINAYKKVVSYLTVEYEGQIQTLVRDIKHETEKMVQSWNISKIGYNSSYMQQIIRHIQTREEKFQTHVSNYKFTDEFFIDLVLTITNAINKTITEQFQKFREANDPVKYLEEKKDEYYNVFQKYCHGATSTAIVGGIVCQKLKEPIEQSVYKKTARELADEVRSNCPSLSGNRTNLEKHILTDLATEENFPEYMKYITNPRDQLKDFIKKTVNQYTKNNFKDRVLLKLENNINLLQEKIITAAQQSSEEMSEKNGEVSLWLKSFTEKISEVVVFSEKDLSVVNLEDVENICLLKDVIKKDLSAVISDISSRFTVSYFVEKLQLQDQPDEILINHLCQCCWAQCPFCGVICTNSIENHDEDHNAPFHRVDGVKRWHFRRTTNLGVDVCTSSVASSTKAFFPKGSEESVPYKDYRSAGEPYSRWNISPDLSELPYWKWFVCRFQKELESFYEKTFEEDGEIPKEWREISKDDAVSSLEKYFK